MGLALRHDAWPSEVSHQRADVRLRLGGESTLHTPQAGQAHASGVPTVGKSAAGLAETGTLYGPLCGVSTGRALVIASSTTRSANTPEEQ